MKNRNNIFLFILLVLIFWKFFSPGPRVANDYPYIYPSALSEAFNLPSTWLSRGGEGMGEPGVFTMWSWPTDFLYGLGGKLGFSFDILQRLFVTVTLYIGITSIRKLLSEFNIKEPALLVASLFYLTTTYFLLLVDGGQLLISLAYAWMPAAFYFLIKSSAVKLKDKLKAAIAISALGFFDIRFIYILFLLYTIYFIYELLFIADNKPEKLFSVIKTGFIIALVYIGLNFYWILPLLLTRNSTTQTLFNRLTEAQSLSFTNIGHALYLLQPHWFKNVFGKISELRPEFVLIPFLVFLAPLTKKGRHIGFWFIVAVAGVFLAKGSNPPLGNFYVWLYKNLPGFSLFRDSTKFFFLVALSYSVMIGYTVEGLSERIKNKVNIGKKAFLVTPVIIIFYIVIVISPVWRGQMTGTVSEPLNKEQFFRFSDIAESDLNFGRIFWVPSRPPLGYSSPIHPSAEALRMAEKRPFYAGTVGTYEVLNFLRETPYMGAIFEVAGIRYLAYPYPDTRREDLSEDAKSYYHKFSDQIDRLGWTGEKISGYPLNVFELNSNKDKFFIAGNTWIVVGSDRIYNEFGEEKYGKLADNALIFAEDTYDARRFAENEFIKILDYETAASIQGPDGDESYYTYKSPLFLSSFLTENPKDNGGWWKKDESDFLWLRNFLQTKYAMDYQELSFGRGVALSEGSNSLNVELNDLSGDEYLFARYLLSSKGGKIKFYQGGKLIFEAITKIDINETVTRTLSGYNDLPEQKFEYEKVEFVTNQVGKLDKNVLDLTIVTEGDINLINFISATSYADIHKQNELHADKWINGRSVNWDNLTTSEKNSLFRVNNESRVNYKRISQSHYKVTVEGVKAPSTLVFSETYDPMWEMGGIEAYPVYTLLNGFYIDKDGEYDIYYRPQKYVIPGLLFSTSALLIIIYLYITLPDVYAKKNK